MKSSFTVIITLLLLFVCQIAATGAAEKMDADIIVEKSRIVIEEMIRSPDNELALDLIKKSAGLAIIPGMLKAGFVVGGSYGKGVLLSHRDGRWTGPAFVYIWAGSLGLQIGVQSTDLILVVMGQKAMRSFLKSKFKHLMIPYFAPYGELSLASRSLSKVYFTSSAVNSPYPLCHWTPFRRWNV